MKKKAYEELKFYQNICEIRKIIFDLTEHFGGIHIRLVRQMRDAARSAKQNIIEGYQKDSAGEFGHAIKISRGSLGELEGDIDDCFEDDLIPRQPYEILKNLLGKTCYQIDRYLDSLYRMEKEGRWKSRFAKKGKNRIAEK